MITGIDHPLIAIADMARASEAYSRLGFTIPPKGSHVEWGTGNWCIMFESDYLELRGILRDDLPLKGLDKWLNAHGEGMMGVAFGTDDANASRESLRKNGIAISSFSTLKRNSEHPTGWTQPEFTLCFPHEVDVYGLGHVVLCEHKTPELLRPHGSTQHPNGVERLVGIEGTVSDLDTAESAQRKFLGSDAVLRNGDTLLLRLPRQQAITLRKTKSGEQEGLSGIILQARDLEETRAFLINNGVTFSTSEGEASLFVASEEACGVIIRFISA